MQGADDVGDVEALLKSAIEVGHYENVILYELTPFVPTRFNFGWCISLHFVVLLCNTDRFTASVSSKRGVVTLQWKDNLVTGALLSPSLTWVSYHFR